MILTDTPHHINMLALLGGLIACFYFLLRPVYRLYFHSLRQFPGPRIAAITSGYSIYHNIFQGGISIILPALHEKYGPVVRIGPDELHFSSPKAYKIIYSSDTTFIKDPGFYQFFGAPRATFSMISPTECKPRREQLSNFFSRRNISSLQHIVVRKVEKLEKNANTLDGIAINFHHAYRCLTLDVITEMMFGVTAGCLDSAQNGFDHPLLHALEEGLHMMWWQRHFAIVTKIMLGFLPSIAKWMPDNCPGIPVARLFDVSTTIPLLFCPTFNAKF